jgi:hypothetical protein
LGENIPATKSAVEALEGTHPIAPPTMYSQVFQTMRSQLLDAATQNKILPTAVADLASTQQFFRTGGSEQTSAPLNTVHGYQTVVTPNGGMGAPPLHGQSGQSYAQNPSPTNPPHNQPSANNQPSNSYIHIVVDNPSNRGGRFRQGAGAVQGNQANTSTQPNDGGQFQYSNRRGRGGGYGRGGRGYQSRNKRGKGGQRGGGANTVPTEPNTSNPPQ